jgi:lipid-binding SYLF domain-containing protein
LAGGGLAAGHHRKERRTSLERLYPKELAAKTIAVKAKTILLFFNVLKAGFGGWAHDGEGVLCGF